MAGTVIAIHRYRLDDECGYVNLYDISISGGDTVGLAVPATVGRIALLIGITRQDTIGNVILYVGGAPGLGLPLLTNDASIGFITITNFLLMRHSYYSLIDGEIWIDAKAGSSNLTHAVLECVCNK